MRFTEQLELDADDFNDYEDAEIQYFELNQNGVICYYTKEGMTLSFGAASLKDAMMMWNTHMI